MGGQTEMIEHGIQSLSGAYTQNNSPTQF